MMNAGKSEGLLIRELEDRVSALEEMLTRVVTTCDSAPGLDYTVALTMEYTGDKKIRILSVDRAPRKQESKPATFVEAWQWMLEGGLVRQRGYLYKIEDGVLFYSVRAGSWRQEEKVYPETFLFGDWTLLPREGV